MSKSCEHSTCTLLISHVNIVLVAFREQKRGTRRDVLVAVSSGPSYDIQPGDGMGQDLNMWSV